MFIFRWEVFFYIQKIKFKYLKYFVFFGNLLRKMLIQRSRVLKLLRICVLGQKQQPDLRCRRTGRAVWWPENG
jgi:hypothetical protein